MKIVGITGGIGAGKSVVCRIFQVLDVPVYDADRRAKSLMNDHAGIRNRVVELFGPESYDHGVLNRVHIGKIAFHQPDLLKQLNQVVHPAVAEDFDAWCKAQHSVYVLKEAALLVETGSYGSLDHLIVVAASPEIRTKRVLKRDTHRNEQDVRAIMERQSSESEKVKLADTVIQNNETQLVIPQVLQVHQFLLQS